MHDLHIGHGFTLPIEAVTQTFAVLAKRGSGKSYLASVMAEEMLKTGQQVVALDPTGGWWGLRSGYPQARQQELERLRRENAAYAAEALTALTGVTCTPEAGYAKDGGPGQMGADIRWLRRAYEALREAARPFMEWARRREESRKALGLQPLSLFAAEPLFFGLGQDSWQPLKYPVPRVGDLLRLVEAAAKDPG